MGGVNVLHGVSTGAVAFLTGLYEEWIYSLACFDRESFQLLFRFRIREWWTKINGPFLATVMTGFLVGLFVITSVLFQLMLYYPIPLNAFFFGIILLASPLALRKIEQWNIATALALVAGIGISYGLTLLPAFATPDDFWIVILCGFVVAIGLVWPGISCSFILLLLGKYGMITTAMHTFQLKILILFLLGFIPGLIVNARISRSLLVHYHYTGVALLAGLMLGALNKLWPWRDVIEFMPNRKGEQIPAIDKSILPWDYMATTSKDPLVFQAILMMALGVFIVVLTVKIGARLKTKI
jgi:putative membrane protein